MTILKKRLKSGDRTTRKPLLLKTAENTNEIRNEPSKYTHMV